MIGMILLAIILAFLAVLVIRALRFTPKSQPVTEKDPIDFDKDAAVIALQKLVQCKTVSNVNHELEDEAEFQKLIDLLPELYPNVWKVCTFTRFPNRGSSSTGKARPPISLL